MFLSALIGSIFGYLTGVFADTIVIFFARRNGGVKEPEMRLWTLCISFIYAGIGYLLYGWAADAGLPWIAAAIGLGAMIAHQVSACSIATAYAMDCFPGVSKAESETQVAVLIPSIDFWRNCCHPRHLLLLHQLRDQPISTILHRRHQHGSGLHFLRHHGHAQHGRGGADGYLGQRVAQEVCTEVQRVFEHKRRATVRSLCVW